MLYRLSYGLPLSSSGAAGTIGLWGGGINPRNHDETLPEHQRHLGKKFGETMDPLDRNMKFYRAIIWIRDSDRPGQRVSVLAENLKEARAKLEAEHGEGNVFNLYNEEEAARLR